MTAIDLAALDRALALLPDRFRGPAGVAGVVHQGRVIARRAWGFADVAQRVPMTPALLLDMFDRPEALDPLLPDLLPHYRGPLPTVAQLCHNQSGLRDYWAMTVLQGAAPEGRFTEADGRALLAQARGGQFAPGAHFSYCNGNFRLLAELIQRATGRDFATLLQEHIFDPAAMPTARLAADMAERIDGVIGYEGNDEVGFVPADSAITWFGDSGVAASLDDMLAWEAFIDAGRDDPAALYNRITVPVRFADGKPASYGYGLRRYRRGGVEVTAHGGGVRGFCSYRLHVAAKRLSVVVIFNHEASAMRAAEGLMAAALGLEGAKAVGPGRGWDGLWYDDENELFLRTRDVPGGVRLHYAVSATVLPQTAEGQAGDAEVSLHRDAAFLVMERATENLTVRARRLTPLDWADATPIAGRYHSAEIDAALVIEARDGAASIGFDGMLGTGPMERMYPLAEDLWTVTSRRAMDAAPPGEWTLRIRRDEGGRVAGLTLGCWLARKIDYSLSAKEQ